MYNHSDRFCCCVSTPHANDLLGAGYLHKYSCSTSIASPPISCLFSFSGFSNHIYLFRLKVRMALCDVQGSQAQSPLKLPPIKHRGNHALSMLINKPSMKSPPATGMSFATLPAQSLVQGSIGIPATESPKPSQMASHQRASTEIISPASRHRSLRPHQPPSHQHPQWAPPSSRQCAKT